MNKIKFAVSTGAASVVMALGFALPAAAATQSTVCVSGAISSNICPNVNVDLSRKRTTTLGNGSAIIRNNVLQAQSTSAVTTQANVGVASGVGVGGAGTGTGVGVLGGGTGTGVGGAGTGTGSNTQSNSSTTTVVGSQSNTVTFAPTL